MKTIMDELRLVVAKAYLSPERAAAYEAAMEALSVPNSLIRVTFTDVRQILETAAPLEFALRKAGVFDEAKSLENQRRGDTTFELTNGSGIEFKIDTSAKQKRTP